MSWQTYYDNLASQLFIMLIPPFIKAGIYYLTLTRGNGIKCYITFVLAVFLPGIILSLLPFTLPNFLMLFIKIAAAVLISDHYADVGLSVKSISIFTVVEVGFYFLIMFIMQSV